VREDGNDVLAVYQVTREAVERARAGEGVTLVELVTYRRKGHAEHDNQSYVPPGERERWAAENDPVDRYRQVLAQAGTSIGELDSIDARVAAEVDAATELAEQSPMPEARDALVGIYADPPAAPELWFRRDVGRVVDAHERPASWGTYDG
jgi:pyruvate dehydrogenase E1 component alpha subunit/2-oxoisovalerate dehydrogenase E1 component alpha subunit